MRGGGSLRHIGRVRGGSAAIVGRILHFVVVEVPESVDRVAHGAKRTERVRIVRTDSDGATRKRNRSADSSDRRD